jgi:hypothetical protein
MAEEIIDGTGTGNRAKIDKHKRLHVDAITFGRSEQEVELGNGYSVNTGTFSLTSANKSACLYLKNDEDFDLVLTIMVYILGNSNANGDCTIDVLRNPTTGTLIDGAVAAEMPGVNRNFGSSLSLKDTTLVYKGAEGNTFTNGTKVISSIVQTPSRTPIIIGDIVLPKGSSIGFDVTPPTGNTAMDIQLGLGFFIDTLKDIT